MPFNAWPKKRPLTIDRTKVGAGTHSQFPLRLRLSDATLSSRLRPDGIDLVVADSDGATALNYQRVQYAADLQDRFAWSWYPGDRAYYDSTANAVIVTFTDYYHIHAGKYDVATGTWTTAVMRPGAGGDDHNHGCVARASDGSVLSVPLIHNDTSIALYYSDAAASIKTWTAVTIDATSGKDYNYPHLFITSDGRLHCFTRRAPAANQAWRDIAVYTSGQSSAPYTTWSSAAIILDASTSIQDYTYHKLVFDSATDSVYAVGGLYPGSTGSHNLYAFKMVWNGSAWTAARLDGTAITLPMTALSAGTLAYTEVASEGPWIIDVARKGGELFAMFETYPNPDTDHRLWCVRTTSGVFGARESIGGAIGGSIAPGGASNYYGGEGCFNPDDADECLISNASGGTHEMQRWTAAGGVWTKAEDLTNYSIAGRKNIRPFWIRNAPIALKAIWCEGVYAGYTHPNYDLQALTFPRRVKPICDVTVRVPSLDGAADKTLFLYCGNFAATEQAVGATSVWDSNTFIVCYGRDVRDDGTKLRNEISGTNAVKALATRPIQAVAPLFGNAQLFGTTPSVAFSAADLNINGVTGLTVESLARLDDGGVNRAIGDSGFDASAAQYLLRTEASTRKIGAYVIGSDGASHGGFSTLVMPLSETHHVGLVFDGSATKVSAVLDGVSVASATGAGLDALKAGGVPTAPMWGTYSTPWNGAMEEYVVAKVARGDGWMLTRANNLRSPTTFFSLGMEMDNTASGARRSLFPRSGSRGVL